VSSWDVKSAGVRGRSFCLVVKREKREEGRRGEGERVGMFV
jgi:hypothetical protein